MDESPQIQPTTESSFADDVLTSEQSVLIFVWAPWCHNCKTMTPYIEKMAVERKNDLQFFKLNGDENRELLKRYKVFGLPTFLLFSHGRLVFRKTGSIGIGSLTKKIAPFKILSEKQAAAQEIKGIFRWPF